MPAPIQTTLGGGTVDVQHQLGELLLELAGKSAGRMLTAKRHVGILADAIPLLDKSQQIIARRRIAALEDRWGPLGDDADGGVAKVGADTSSPLISPELRTARWLSKRRGWGGHIRILNRAAMFFQAGGTGLSDAQEYAFALETDGVVRDVGLSSFTEWMLELRIAERIGKRVYGPGELCEWWANEMVPTKSQGTAYNACISLATELCRRRLPHRR